MFFLYHCCRKRYLFNSNIVLPETVSAPFEKLCPTNISTITENTSGDRYPGNGDGNFQINHYENNYPEMETVLFR